VSQFYFAWSGQLDAWSAAMLREDEEIFSITITHAEGDFATLQIDVKNPRVGLLAAGRNLWCWLSYTSDPLVLGYPIFRGRLIGVPENLSEEVVRLQFVARPEDYQAQKVAVAEPLKVPPYWDPVWLQANIDDPDTVLESRPQLWHIDRVTLAVTTSDIIEGEDGVVEVTADDHFYDTMTITYGQTPLRRVNMSGTVTWDQTGGGTIDLTAPLVSAFQAAGSPLPSPLISSLTGDGLFNSWPAPGSSIGGGWSMGLGSFVLTADWIKPAYYKKVWTGADHFPVPAPLPEAKGVLPPDAAPNGWVAPVAWEFPYDAALGQFNIPAMPTVLYGAAFPITPLQVHFTADWVAKRGRSETVSFTLDADVQSIITDPGQDEEATVTLNSAAITQGIDPGGATPISDLRSPIYFKSDRGVQSVEYLLMLAAAKLLARARCVIIRFSTSWDFVIQWISCRHSARLFDPRLPGGVAQGKITGYTLSFSTNGISAEVTINCAIGHGGSVEASPGEPSYSGDYVDAYQALLDGQVAPIPGQVVYQSLDNFQVIEDDGLDLFNMTPNNVLKSTPAVSLTTTGSILAGSPKLSTMASDEGLLAGDTYAISGAAIPFGASFVYDGGLSGTMSLVPLVTIIGTTVTITGAAQNGFTITNGVIDQVNAIDIGAARRMMPDPIGALKIAPTRVCVDLISTDGGSFHTDFPLVVEPMSVPKLIDLEASS